jgi:hypothetical protein
MQAAVVTDYGDALLLPDGAPAACARARARRGWRPPRPAPLTHAPRRPATERPPLGRVGAGAEMVLELNKRIKASGQQKVGILEEIKAGGKQTAELFWEKARLELEAVDLGDHPPPALPHKIGYLAPQSAHGGGGCTPSGYS